MMPPIETAPEARPEETAYWTYQDLALFILMALPSLVLATLLAGLLKSYFGVPTGRAAFLLLAQFTGYGFWFACLFLLLKTRYDRPFWKSLGWVTPRWNIFSTAFLGPMLAIGIVVLGVLLKTPDIEMPIKDLLSDWTSVILVGLFATTLGPLCEELAFRGFFQPLLIRSLGPAAGIALSALLFALPHGQQYSWSWRHLLLLTLAGIAFGWVRQSSRSTLAATVVHAAYNLTFFVIYLMQAKDKASLW